MRVMSVRELIIELLSGSMEGAVVEIAPTVYSINQGAGEQPAPAEAVAVQPTGQAKVVPADLGPISPPEPAFEMYVEGQPAPPKINEAVRLFPEEDS